LVKLHGRTVESAGSCSAARRLDQDFDCGIFDVELPDGSGVDLAAELLQEKRVQRVVFFTATGEESLCERASRLGEVFRKHDGIGQLERVIFDCQHVSANGG
jgi:DNA-binding NarL/FixJ family response regulator